MSMLFSARRCFVAALRPAVARPQQVRLLSTGPQRFKVLGLQQIAIGGLDKSALSELWVNQFGIEKVGDYVAESENVDEDILRLGKGPYAVEASAGAA